MNIQSIQNIQQVNNLWLSELIQRQVDSFEIVPIGEGVGFLSSLFKITISSSDSTIEIVIKLPPSTDGPSSFVCEHGLHIAEASFYRFASQSLPGLSRYLPACFLASPESLVLSFIPGHPISFAECPTLSQIQLVMGILAQLHASTWYPSSSSSSSSSISTLSHSSGIREFDDERTENLLLSCFSDLPDLPLLSEHLVALLPVELSHVLHDQAFKSWLSPDAVRATISNCCGKNYHGPRALVHGDLWSGNIIFEPSLILLDWQFAIFSNPILDVALFLCSSCDPQHYFLKADRTLIWETYLDQFVLTSPSLSAWTLEEMDQAFLSILPYIWLIFIASIPAWIKPHHIETISKRYSSLLELIVKNQF